MRKHGSSSGGGGGSGGGIDVGSEGGSDGGSGGGSGDGRFSAHTLAETAAANGRRSVSNAQDTTLAAVEGNNPAKRKHISQIDGGGGCGAHDTTLAAEATVVVAAVAAGAVETVGTIQENGCVQSVTSENEFGDDVEQIGNKRGLSAVYGSSSGLAAQDEQADDSVTGTIFEAGTAATVVVTSAADAVAVITKPSANYPDYYHGLSRQQRNDWRKRHRRK
jgi:hypothetical protein